MHSQLKQKEKTRLVLVKIFSYIIKDDDSNKGKWTIL
jgi:hypothetical protein